MARRHVEWARRKRDELRDALGGACDICQATLAETVLHFDVIIPCLKDNGRHHRKLGWQQRMIFYRRQHAAGNLRLLCESCNGKKGSTADKRYHQAMRTDAEVEKWAI